jgi:hypothetical protein
MVYSLKQAAEAAGVGKPAILKALKNGRISGQKNAKGEWEIQPAELHRVYPVNASGTGTGEQQEPGKDAGEYRALQAEIELLKERLADRDRRIRELEEDRAHWREQAERTTRLLTDQRGGNRPGFWQRLTGK